MVSDDFWELEKLIPKKRYICKSNDITTSLVEDGNSDSNKVYIKSFFDFRTSTYQGDTISEYTYSQGSSVIIKAAVVNAKDKYVYSDNLIEEAKKYSVMKSPLNAEYTPFFAFAPGHKALNERQQLWYLYWREKVKCNVFLPTDFSYIYLFAYELLNSTDKNNAEENLSFLISLWKNYHEKYPQITKHMYDWVLDFCVTYNLSIPFESLDGIIPYLSLACDSILKNMYIFDYLLRKNEVLNERCGNFVIDAVSKYNYRKSKYYLSDTDFASCLTKAQIDIMSHLLRSSEPDGGFFRDRLSLLPSFEVTPVKLIRPLFPGAVVSYKLKHNLVIEYYPYVKDELLSGAISEIVKYIENKVRAVHKIKARMSAHITNDCTKAIIDRYFERRTLKKPEPLSTPRKLEIDINIAKNIDELSWQTTKKLTDYMDTEYFEDDKLEILETNALPKATADGDNAYSTLAKSLNEFELQAVKAILSGEGVDVLKKKSAIFIEDIMDSVNEKAIEITGDIIFDIEACSIIECYTNDIYLALKNLP